MTARNFRALVGVMFLGAFITTTYGMDLGETTFACPASPQRLEIVEKKYGALISDARSTKANEETWKEDRQWTLKALAVIPDEYLTYVFDYHQAPIVFVDDHYTNEDGTYFHPDIRGITTLVVMGEEWLQAPKKIAMKPARHNHIRIKNGVEEGVGPKYFGLRHEIGHIIYHYLNMSVRGFWQAHENLYDASVTSGSKHNSYARNKIEYFPELFSGFYCSPESRRNMEVDFPLEHALAKKFLIDPEKLEAAGSGDTPAAQGLDVDLDGDHVTTFFDFCPNTPKGKTVRNAKGVYGCAEDETPGKSGYYKAVNGETAIQ